MNKHFLWIPKQRTIFNYLNRNAKISEITTERFAIFPRLISQIKKILFKLTWAESSSEQVIKAQVLGQRGFEFFQMERPHLTLGDNYKIAKVKNLISMQSIALFVYQDADMLFLTKYT